MANPDVIQHLWAIWDAHAVAFAEVKQANAAMREANAAHDRAVSGIEAAFTELRASSAAHDRAFEAHDRLIDAAIAANQAGIDLLMALREEQS